MVSFWTICGNISEKVAAMEEQNPFVALQTHLSSLHHLLNNSFKTPLQNSLMNLHAHVNRTFQSAISHFSPPSPAPPRTPSWARISAPTSAAIAPSRHRPMSTEEMEERLAGVPVYALSNAAEEFVLVSGARTGRRLGLFCFREEDAEALLEQVRVMDPAMRQGSKVVPVALNKVFQLKVGGVAFRFIPDSHEIVNALKEIERMGDSTAGFSGVPVFQSRSLILNSGNKRYRPVFFRKEDLERSLLRASRDQRQMNPAFKQGDLNVCVFEEIIKDMKESSASKWDDIVFIPPGFDVSTGAAH